MRLHSLPDAAIALLVPTVLGLAFPAVGQAADPFGSAALTAEMPGGSLQRPLRAAPCTWGQQNALLNLPDVVDRALCNNPQTREAWANARYQAAQVGVAESAYLPGLDLALSANRTSANDVRSTQRTATLSLSYLLYDFGGREATLENAQQIMAAANATQETTLQSVFLVTVQAYYQWQAAQTVVTAAKESERASQESLKAAVARYRAGTATPADRLQAQTALSQATLARIRAEGNARTAQGALANAMGLPADAAIAVAPADGRVPDTQFDHKVAELIDAAKRQRPDLAAAEAQVQAARSAIDMARAGGLPSVSLFANRSQSRGSLADAGRSDVIGVSLNVPIFSGFNTTYRVRAAEAQLEARTAQRDRLAQQVVLDVWNAYHALQTESEAVRAAADLLASATQSERVAAGRYRAGVGNILDLLSAQSALASARQQHIQELYNWRLARIALAQAIGQLDFAALEAASR